ncbi:MAG: gfo/Idh/MocA family oxidoreductase, partial [Thermoprotei archaeon]
MSLKIAVVGVGRWGRNHVRVLKKLLNMGEIDELILVDTNPATLKKIAKEYKIQKTYRNINEMKNREKPDAAIIAVPTPLHYRVATSLLNSTDLLIEKPIAVNIEEALEIVKLAEKEERVVAVGHIERFNPAITTLRER